MVSTMRWLWLLLLLAALRSPPPAVAQATRQHEVAVGDTWAALAWRYGLAPADLAPLQSLNPQRQPPIGDTLALPDRGVDRTGHVWRRQDGGLLAVALLNNTSPWTVALQHQLASPYRPLAWQPLFFAGGSEPPRDLPVGVADLAVSRAPALPGQALGMRAALPQPLPVTAWLGAQAVDTFATGTAVVGLAGTSSFYEPGAPELALQVGAAPLWSQPWRIVDGSWDFDQVTLTGSAAQIDQESIRQERERLQAIWAQRTPEPLWQGPFSLPLVDYLRVSSNYGARRSYNGGPYSSAHEGVDFAAYGGTQVQASAAGTVVLAETLYVRGGAVIIDHGLGVFTGYYHMSAVHVNPGDQVKPGHQLGEVGSTGLSSGNHLHWDMLVNGAWIDAAAWVAQDLGCWLLAGWNRPCHSP